jgi:cell division protein FtsX
MKAQLIKTESSLWVNFKRTMYALMVIVIAIAIPLLGYLELSYNDNTDNQKENNVKVQNMAGSTVKENTVKF